MIWIKLLGNELKPEEQEGARVQTWHTKQGVFRKKLLLDVRDDPLGDPPSEI